MTENVSKPMKSPMPTSEESEKNIDKLSHGNMEPNQIDSPIKPTEKSKNPIALFSQNSDRFPVVIRSFYSTIPKSNNDGGLSVEEQSNIIHHGIKLEKTILDLINQYNTYIEQMGKIAPLILHANQT